VERDYSRDRNCPQPVEPGHVPLPSSEGLRHVLPNYDRPGEGDAALREKSTFHGRPRLDSAGPRQTQRSVPASGSAEPRITVSQFAPVLPSFFDMVARPGTPTRIAVIGQVFADCYSPHRPQAARTDLGTHTSGQFPVLNSPSRVHTGPACHEKA
jgi:hypothetical protein